MSWRFKDKAMWGGLALSLLLCLHIKAWAAPNLVSYQGILKDSGGVPLAGPVDMTFRVFDAETGGAALWAEAHTGVNLHDGVYHVLLGNGSTVTGIFNPTLFGGDDRWLEVAVNGEALTPRIRITSAIFSLRSVLAESATDADEAFNAHMLDGKHASDIANERTAHIALHTADASAHHARYADGEAISAMGPKLDLNPLHHDKFTGLEAVAAMGAKDDSNPLRHDRYSDAEARAAVDDGTYMKRYDKVIVVSDDGKGDFSDPQSAVGSISDASAANPYLVKIMPGVYDIGSAYLRMKEYVDIEGCGELTTKITGNTANVAVGVILGADNAELRHLTVENTGGGSWATAIRSTNASPRLNHVTAISSGGTDKNFAIYNYTNASTVMTHVTAIASGAADENYGVYNLSGSHAVMNHVKAGASGANNFNYGIYNKSSSPLMNDVTATASGGDAYGIYNHWSFADMNGVSAAASGANNNIGIFNLACSPDMNNIKAEVHGGNYNYSIVNQDASPAMNNVIATAGAQGGGTYCYAIRMYGASSPAMINVTATARGGSYARALFYSGSGSPLLKQSHFHASGATVSSYGIYSSSSGALKIDGCTISGSNNSIVRGSSGAVLVGNSKVEGTVSGALTCVGAYDGTYAALDNTCN